MFAYINALALTPRRQAIVVACAAVLTFSAGLTGSGSAFAQQSPNNPGGNFGTNVGGGGFSPNYPGTNRYPCLVTRSCRTTNCECRIRRGKRSCRYPTILAGSISFRACLPKG